MKTLTATLLTLIFFLVFVPTSAISQTNLSPGDIAFIGFNSDDPDGFSVIALATIASGTSVNFTDNGWESNNTLTTNEGHIIWTAPLAGISFGDIITFNYESGWSSSIGSVTSGGGTFSLSASGDQILSYQVPSDTTFIAAIHFNGDGWELDATDTQTSKLPSGLTNNTDALSIGEADNAVFVGKLTGTQSELLSKINNPDNWFSSSSYSFQITENDFPYNIWKSTVAEWNDASKWFTGSVPDANDHAYIQGTRDPYISSSTYAVCKKITLAANSSLTIQSDNSGTGSFICEELALESEVVFNVQRYIPSTNWHLVSSPVAGQELDAFGSLPANAIVKYPATNPTEYNLSTYKESDDTWTFVSIGASGTFNNGQGYSLQRSSADVVTFSGNNIYTGNQSIGISGTENFGWNCIGNPYTSPINAALFLSTNASQLDPSFQYVYLWDQSGNDYTNINSGNIALAQGFFVNSKDGGASINFEKSMQVSGSATFKSDEIQLPALKLMVNGDGLYNETLVSFQSGMSYGLDPGFDGGKLKGNPDIALYTKLVEDNGIDFAIQALPEIGNEVVRIPVGLDFAPGGEVSFSLKKINMPDDIQVYLEDSQSETKTQLSNTETNYTVNLAADTKATGRFYLIVSKSGTTSIQDKTTKVNFNIWIREKTIFINGLPDNNTSCSLFGIDGRIHFIQKLQHIDKHRFDVSGLPPGIYILKLNQNSLGYVKKFVIP